MKQKAIYFPGLNGFRAIAALAVVVSHITQSLGEFGLNPFIFGITREGKPAGVSLAGYGVGVFFVLSGFLITYLLQAEKDVQEIDIKKFYIRRILRIWPLYYVYLAISVSVILYLHLYFNFTSLLFYIFYAANIPYLLNTMLKFLGHYWSLGVEEQFYLFWPWFNKKITNLIPVIIVLIGSIIGIKLFVHHYYPDTMQENIMSNISYHQMMMGALGALLYKQGNQLFLRITDNVVTQGICWLMIFLAALNKFHVASVIDGDLICIAALALIIGQVNIRNRIFNLENNVFDFLGKISYGIYVIHPLLIFLIAKVIGPLSMPDCVKYLIVYASVLSLTILVSYLSYTYFEKYFLTLKSKFVVVNSSATKTEA